MQFKISLKTVKNTQFERFLLFFLFRRDLKLYIWLEEIIKDRKVGNATFNYESYGGYFNEHKGECTVYFCSWWA